MGNDGWVTRSVPEQADSNDGWVTRAEPAPDPMMEGVPSPTEVGVRPVPDAPIGERIAAGVAGFADTATLGLGDETAAGMRAVNDKFLDLTGIQPSDKSYTEMYQDRLGTQRDVRDQYASQYPTEFGQGELTAMGTQMFSPTTMTKSAATMAAKPLLKAKAAGDSVVKGAGNVVKSTIDNIASNETAKNIVGAGRVNTVANVLKKATPETMGDVAAMGGGAAVSVTNPALGAATGIGVKRAVDAGIRKLGQYKRVWNPKNNKESDELFDMLDSMKPGGVESKIFNAGANAADRVNKIAKNKFMQKYGSWMVDIVNRTGSGAPDAIAANVFIRQQQDPEFREMLRAAKAEKMKE